MSVSLNELLGLGGAEATRPPLPRALEEFAQLASFKEAIAAQAVRWRMPEAEVEQGWVESLAAIRVGRHSPRTASDYQFVFEVVRRVLG